MLAANGELHLRQQSFDPDLNNAANELVASADITEIRAVLGWLFAQRLVEISIELTLRDAVTSARRPYGAQLALVDPLLETGVADAQDNRSIPRPQQLFRLGAHECILARPCIHPDFCSFSSTSFAAARSSTANPKDLNTLVADCGSGFVAASSSPSSA